jgi:hypothetical protein
MSDKFRFFIPDIDISKGKDKEGNETMIVEGVASTMTEDTDGEIVDPNGFDLNYLLDQGFINWHHATKDNPGTIIGEPVKAWVQDSKLHVRAELYSWQPIARDVYDIINQLQKGKSKRKLGWSIEGKKMEVDPMNKKFIRKSRVTGIAITPMPKNKGTYVDISKGENYDYDTYDLNGESIILDIKKGEDSIIIDKFFNIKRFIKGVERKPFLSLENAANITIIEKGFKLGFIPKDEYLKVLKRIKGLLENS